MEIINPSFEILSLGAFEDPIKILKHIEKIARTCYKSEEKITDTSYENMLSKLIRLGHLAMIEHGGLLTVKFICNRGFSHELVRHRLASYAQESTRYVDYNNKEVKIIKPDYQFSEDSLKIWKSSIENSLNNYKLLRENKVPPEIARGVLPIDLKTEIVISANYREWRTIFSLRCSPKAHPSMRQLMIPLLKELQTKLPIIFDDVNIGDNN